MDTPPVAAAGPETFRDRKVGLIIFGILTIVMGLFCLFFFLAGIATLFLPALTAGTSPNAMHPNAAIVGLGIYGVLGVANIWLGIGSILARRWARALLLIISWSWLIIGICMVTAFGIMFPQIMDTASLSQGANASTYPHAFKTILLTTGVFFCGIFILLPFCWMLFYRSKNVKATCEARDPVIRWTDRCPLPPLAVSLWLIYGALSMLWMPMMQISVIPFFGMILSGAAATAVYIGLAIIWLYCAYAFYKLDLRGWWLIIIVLCLNVISYGITVSHHSIMEMTAMMYKGMPEEQLKLIQNYSNVSNPLVIWMGSFGFLLMLGYIIYTRKFFAKKLA